MKNILNWEIGEKIGSGAYGNVYIAENKFYKKTFFVIKILKNNSPSKIKEIKVYKKLKNLQGKLLPKLYEYGRDNYGNFYIVLEKLNTSYSKIYNIRKVIESLYYLSERKIIHGDIKQENILYRNNEIVLIDWGLSCSIDSKNDVPLGTPLFMSVFAHEGKISYRNDLESLLYSILNEIYPLDWTNLCFQLIENNRKEIMDKILSMKYLFINNIITKNNDTMQRYHLYDLYNVYKFAVLVFRLERTDIPNYELLISCFP